MAGRHIASKTPHTSTWQRKVASTPNALLVAADPQTSTPVALRERFERRSRGHRWLEAECNYVTLHVVDGKTHLVHETLANLEARLDASRSVRIHRSTIVRVNRIKELLPHFNGEYVVVLKDGTRLKLSRSFLDTARVALGLQ